MVKVIRSKNMRRFPEEFEVEPSLLRQLIELVEVELVEYESRKAPKGVRKRLEIAQAVLYDQFVEQPLNVYDTVDQAADLVKHLSRVYREYYFCNSSYRDQCHYEQFKILEIKVRQLFNAPHVPTPSDPQRLVISRGKMKDLNGPANAAKIMLGKVFFWGSARTMDAKLQLVRE